MQDGIENLERQIGRAETLLIFLSVASIAAADYYAGPALSLGPLYLIPLCYSALSRPPRFTFGLFLTCLLFREYLGPIWHPERPWFFFVRDLLIAAAFLAVVGTLARLNRERRRFFELSRSQRDELAAEVELAADVQQRLLALSELPTGRLDVFARTRPLKGVGGDYYDFIELGENRVAVVIADIAGKGLPAAMLMPAVRIALRGILEDERRPEIVVEELNRILVETTDARSYATLLLAIVDVAASRVCYVNAGHVSGLVRSPAGDVRELPPGGPPVGLLDSATYEPGSVDLPGGAILVLATDGVLEALNPEGEEFGEARWRRAVERAAGESADQSVRSIRAELAAFRGDENFTDDVTVIVVRMRPGAAAPVRVAGHLDRSLAAVAENDPDPFRRRASVDRTGDES